MGCLTRFPEWGCAKISDNWTDRTDRTVLTPEVSRTERRVAGFPL